MTKTAKFCSKIKTAGFSSATMAVVMELELKTNGSILAKLTHAPRNGAAIGGLKVVTENGWFAARPLGTEDMYKIYVESFWGREHLDRIKAEAQAMVDGVLSGA